MRRNMDLEANTAAVSVFAMLAIIAVSAVAGWLWAL